MFRLSHDEANSLRSQFVTSNVGRGGRRYLPYAFTEHGVAMLSAVLNSDRAVHMSILIVRAFVKLRELMAAIKTWRAKLTSWRPAKDYRRVHRQSTARFSSPLSKTSRN